MHIEAIAKKPPTDNQINWVTAFFMVSFHVGAVACGRRPRGKSPPYG
jgi:hypothetical protein